MGWKTILALSVCGLAATLWWGFHMNGTQYRLSAAVRAGPTGAVLDLTQVAPFDWDRVYFFGPYTPHNEIEKSLGFHWPDVSRTNINSGKGEVLVIFVKDDRVVEWFEHSRREDLDHLARAQGYAREEARFRITWNSRNPKWSLEPLP